jgi:hypothetical protein
MNDLAEACTRLRDDPQRTVLVIPPSVSPKRLPHFPTVLRYYIDRYGLAIEVVTETDVPTLLGTTPAVLPDRLIRLPRSHYQDGTPTQVFADRRGLLKRLRAAGVWLHLLPRLLRWSVITDQLAFLAVLERGVIIPPPGFDALQKPPQHTARPGMRAQAQAWRTILPTMDASEVPRWH